MWLHNFLLDMFLSSDRMVKAFGCLCIVLRVRILKQGMQPICLIILLLVKFAIGISDFGSLLELKNGFDKDPSGEVLTSWDSNSLAADECPQDWFGISCSGGRVTSIMLNDVGLVGYFDFSAIVGLDMLRNLSISNNQFTGTLKAEVSLMESLEYLDLSCNLFLGSVPSQLTNLKNLVLLNLSLNSFNSTMPSSFGNLGQLQYLDLRSNSFMGNVMLFLSQLRSVVYVDLSSNAFTGTMDLGLGKFSFISSVKYFNVSYNNLSGELFTHDGLPFFDNLDVFDASNNHFVGNVPSFNFVVSLRILRLQRNFLSGSLPKALLQESSMILSELDLSLNQLEGPIASITSTTLRNLNLSSNKLSGSPPVKVGRCAIIDLSNNMLSGNLSRIQGWGSYVEVIELSSNLLTGTLPDQTQLLRLTTFKMSNNSVEGVLPLALGLFPELKRIDFSLNQLTGFLPSSLFNSTKLTDINLSFNKLIGNISIMGQPIEESTQNLSLVSLNLSHNELTGYLPPEFGKFHNILVFDLSNNHFQGGIPDDLPGGIKEFNVSYNNLSGYVPENLRKFPDAAFHPGNSLLSYPVSAISPQGGPNISLKKRSPHMRSALQAAMITGLVFGAFVVALFILVYYRTHQQEAGREGSDESKGIHQRISSPPGTSIPNEIAVSSSGFVNLPQDHVMSIQTEYSPKQLGKPVDLLVQESVPDNEVPCSPIFQMSMNPSPSRSHHLPENAGSLGVCSPDKLAGDLHLFDSSLAFSAEELSCAPAEIIGTSCHGTLYKAMLPSGHLLAVKWLKEGIAKGRKEFAREARKLGSIKHPNLVSLQGYYWGPKDHEKLIISNYISASSLDLYLHGTEPRTLPPLSFNERLKISVDIAHCLNYLHNERAIPHGNLKSTNILLETPSLNALLTDYSLHRIMNSAGTSDQVLNAGALGYRPPEFASTSKPCPSLKSDVYAFGVILLELLTGKSSADIISVNLGVVDLTEWVILLAAENRPNECFDMQILDVHNIECLPKGLDDMLEVALRCILPAAERPDINTIYQDLSLIVLHLSSDK